jgi:uncharacterized Zn finger protein (UPF0148 family)
MQKQASARSGRNVVVSYTEPDASAVDGSEEDEEDEEDEDEEDAPCEICRSSANDKQMLLCDGCDKGYHTFCLKPKLKGIPDGDWFCPKCQEKENEKEEDSELDKTVNEKDSEDSEDSELDEALDDSMESLDGSDSEEETDDQIAAREARVKEVQAAAAADAYNRAVATKQALLDTARSLSLPTNPCVRCAPIPPNPFHRNPFCMGFCMEAQGA